MNFTDDRGKFPEFIFISCFIHVSNTIYYKVAKLESHIINLRKHCIM